jgi:hypothetical protein
MHPENVRILSEAAVDIAVIGNNHILDWGYSGLMDTMDILVENKVFCMPVQDRIAGQLPCRRSMIPVMVEFWFFPML